MSNPNGGQTSSGLRRVVTGFDSKGKSVIQLDTVLVPEVNAPGTTGARVFTSTIWSTDSSPAKVLDPQDGGTRKIGGRGIRSPNGRSGSSLLTFRDCIEVS